MKRRAAMVLVPVAILLTVGSALGQTSPVVAHTNLKTTTLAADVVPGLAGLTDLGPVASDQQFNVVIPVAHDTAAIAAYEASLNDPNSATYRHWLTPDQFQAKFGAPAANVAAVRGFA